jgi:hypothetical protein
MIGTPKSQCCESLTNMSALPSVLPREAWT